MQVKKSAYATRWVTYTPYTYLNAQKKAQTDRIVITGVEGKPSNTLVRITIKPT